MSIKPYLKKLKNLFFATLCFLIIITSAHGAMLFNDVSDTHQYSTSIEFLKDNKVIEGYQDGSYKPDQEVNRAEFIKIVVEGLGLSPSNPSENCFPDVPKDEWYAKYVCYAKNVGWVQGYPDGNFKPAQFINKVETLKILAKAASWDLSEYQNGSQAPFNDVDTQEWYWKYLAYAIDHNIIDDSGDAYNPANSMKRGQIAEYMYRDITVRILGLEAYDPSYDDDIAATGLQYPSNMSQEWQDVAAMVRTDIINGLPQKETLVAYMWKEPEVAGTKIGAFDLDESDKQSNETILEDDTWLVFIDLQPGAMWEHETLFVYVDAETYEYDIEAHQGYPFIDDYGMWNTDQMRQLTDFWVYPQTKDINHENLFGAKGSDDEEEEEETIYVYIDSDLNLTYKVEYSLEELLQAEEDRKKAELAGLHAAEAADPKTAADFTGQCQNLPYCENKPGKKLALVIDGFAEGDGFAWEGLSMYKGLDGQGYDSKYLSAVIGKNKENFPTDEFPEEQYPDGSDEHKDNMDYTTMDNITEAFNDLAGQINSCCDEVIIYIGGHGSQFGSIDMNDRAPKWKITYGPGGETNREQDGYQGDEDGGSLSTNGLKELLDKLKSCKVTVFINSCYSGKHIENGINEDVDQTGCLCRTVYTSSTATRPSYGTAWTNNLAGGLGSGKSIADSALDAHNSKKDQGYYSNFTQISSTPVILCSDPDGDGFCTGQENVYGTDPNDEDTDDDTISDYDEIIVHGTDPKDDDTDGDNLTDNDEINVHGTDPKDEDTDGDDLNDQYELFGGTDPKNADTDGDNCNDGKEQLEDHTNPLDPNDHGVACGGGLSGNTGTLLFDKGESTTVAGGSHNVEVNDTYEQSPPKVAVIVIDGGYYEAIVGEIIVLNGIEVEVISIEDGKVKLSFRETTG